MFCSKVVDWNGEENETLPQHTSRQFDFSFFFLLFIVSRSHNTSVGHKPTKTVRFSAQFLINYGPWHFALRTRQKRKNSVFFLRPHTIHLSTPQLPFILNVFNAKQKQFFVSSLGNCNYYRSRDQLWFHYIYPLDLRRRSSFSKYKISFVWGSQNS